MSFHSEHFPDFSFSCDLIGSSSLWSSALLKVFGPHLFFCCPDFFLYWTCTAQHVARLQVGEIAEMILSIDSVRTLVQLGAAMFSSEFTYYIDMQRGIDNCQL